MCYIMIAKKTSNLRDAAIENQLREIAISKTERNQDGFFIDYAGASLRTMNKKEAQTTLNKIPFDNTLMHFRYATMGEKTLTNVHGWDKDGFVFAHNGMASGLSFGEKLAEERAIIEEEEEFNKYYGYHTHEIANPTKDLLMKDADSKILFEKLLAKIAEFGYSDKKIVKAIKWVVNNCYFWGRCVLYDKAHDKAFLFGDWQVYLVGDKYTVFSSAKIHEDEQWERTTHGMKFEFDKQPLTNYIHSEFDGIALIKNFNKPNFHFKLWNTDLKDPKMDEREYTPANTSTVADDREMDIREINEGEQEDIPSSIEEETEELIDLMDSIPDYNGMNPFDLDVYVDETGTHDISNICCNNGCCWIYQSFAYQEYIKEEKINRMFGDTKPKELPIKNEILLEV